jgi:chemosensory pili system protein ChpA (sensor histidine kinase/response regulator)
MMLEGSKSSAAINWVREDLDACLETIRDNLEAFAEDSSQREPLRTVQEELERLNLTFLTMEQEGAGILTDEMIAVGGHMLHNGNADQQESLAALTDAVIVLPSYLDRLQAGHEDLPILLLPTLNELRATYDESLLSEGTLFAPDLDVIIPELSGSEADAIAGSEFTAWARRIRSQYQGALLGWLQEQSKDRLLIPMQDVCEKQYIRLGRNELRRLWWIARLVMDGLRTGSIDNDLPLRRLFARLDLTLKAMAENGEKGPASDTITALSRALLFHAAQSRPGSKATDILRERFKLDELIPDREALLRARGAVTGRDAGLFESIGEAVREELAQIKDTLDMELRTGRVDLEQRAGSVASLQQLGDTLNMLDLPVPAKAVGDLLYSLEETDGVTNMDLDSPLLALAQKLLEVESILDAHMQLLGEPAEERGSEGFIKLTAHEQRQNINCMLDECVHSLHKAQDAIRARLEGDAEADFANPLQHISGALQLASQGEVAGLTEKLERALNAGLADGPDILNRSKNRLETLTDAVAALELYLAGCRDGQANSLSYLEVMHSRLEGLPEASASGDAVPETTIDLPEPQISIPAAKPTSKPIEEPTAKPIEEPTARPVERPAEKIQDQASIPDMPDIDPAMLGIFIEEFDSVVAQLRQQLRVWLENNQDSKAMEELRRGFHTLKGSGRMIGATEIGEFSGHFEELITKLIENKISYKTSVAHAVRLATGALDELKARLLGEHSDLSAEGISGLGRFARMLAIGNEPDVSTLEGVIPESLMALILDGPAAVTDSVSEPQTLELEPREEAGEPVSTEEDLAAEMQTDLTMVQLMVGEVRQYLAELRSTVSGLAAGSDQEVTANLIRAVHTLAGTFAMEPLGQEAELARSLESYLENRQQNKTPVTTGATVTLQTCLHRFQQRLAILQGRNKTTYPLEDSQLLSEIAGLVEHEATFAEAARIALEEESATEEPVIEESIAEVVERQEEPVQPVETLKIDDETDTGTEAETDAGPIQIEDGSIISIFLEEAVEVLERCDTLLNTWRDKLSDQKLVQNLQREIHTFKGGARMAGLDALGNLSHSMETLLERIAANRMQATVASVQALEEGCDHLNIWVEQLQAGRLPEAGRALIRFEKQVAALSVPPLSKTVTEQPAIEETLEEVQPQTAQVIFDAPPEKVTPEKTALEQAAPEKTEQELASGSPSVLEPQQEAASITHKPITHKPEKVDSLQEPAREFMEIQDRPAAIKDQTEEGAGQAQIRVAAELMDSLVNYSGEISIYRSRLEQQLGSVRYNLKEVESTVSRLKEQLRKMEIETEAQMMSRYQRASTKESTEFDPLELDRFSNMQQLSRSVTESVSDLLSLQGMMDDSLRQAESLLTHQSRVSADLQEGLMQTRMTPFGSAAPRLRRVVRSAAAETGKKARLQLRMAGSSDQLDRNVLERITAPLEHMLRNSVAHGIEKPKVRLKRKKPEEGQISVTVEAEATEFVIRVQDDGAGIDLKAVRKRAIERGMIDKKDQVDSRRMVEFIRESGFSTSEKVTGLAGRGVGMDVVNSEIKQIGGSMEIESEPGVGARFTIRIPFSLAVMQAIGVNVGDRQFQIPLNSVAGVARMTPADYAALARTESPVHEFAGEQFPLLELEPLLDAPSLPLDSENVSLLMIRSGERKAAFRVSGLQGHQEIVVKPVGPQISSIPGILGGMIAADGQVVIILDMGPLIRRGLEKAVEPVKEVATPKEEARQPLVLVVDDSITMRKVTSRVLENHSIEVMTAQDGIDAIEKLHDRVPDLMLLDIEMPRMDGYELAQHIRSDARLRHVPIVMITSRSGQKHRKKARDAGANAYLTKPYQETDLVAQVGEMLDMELEMRRSD